MFPGCHAPLAGLSLNDVDDGVEEIGFAMLAAEVLYHVEISRLILQSEKECMVPG